MNSKITLFENIVKDYYNSPYAVAVDCCTHGLELCLRYENSDHIEVPKHTYLSVPMLASKLNITYSWKEESWEDFYYITDKIVDAAVYWKKNSYIKGTYFVLSFQFKKHLSLGRGGMILTDNEEAAIELKKMAYDGRDNNTGPWAEQNIETIGYHYYMTPETAELGISKFQAATDSVPKLWSYKDYPDLTKFKVFNNGTSK